MCRLRLVLPGSRYDVSTSPRLPAVVKKNVVHLALSGGADRATQISWSPRRRSKSANRTARLRAEVKTRVVVSERTARCTSFVDYSIRGGEVDLLRLQLPEGTEVVGAECPSIAGWNVTEGQLNVALSRPVTEQLRLKVVYESPIDNINSTWELPSLTVLNVRSVKGWVAVGCNGSLEVNTADLDESRNVEPHQLPQELRTGTVLAAVKYSSQPYRITLETRKGEEVALLTASIDSGQVRTLVTSDGKIVSHFHYQMRNNRKQYLELQLPEGQVIWSAFVAGKAVKPVQTQEGRVKLPLVSSVNGAPFPVELTCVSSHSQSWWMGRERLQAPEVDVPISRLNWTVHLPGKREVLSFSGDMQPVSSTPTSSTYGDMIPDEVSNAPAEDKTMEEAGEADAPAPATGSLKNLDRRMMKHGHHHPTGQLPRANSRPGSGSLLLLSEVDGHR